MEIFLKILLYIYIFRKRFFKILFWEIPFPYRYPLEENARENRAEDERCLAQTEEVIEAQKKAGNPVAGIIVEPIQSEGGDHHGSKEWFQVKALFLTIFS